MDWIRWIKTNENEALSRLYQFCKSEATERVQREFSCTRDDALDIFQTAVVILYDNVVSGKLDHLTADISTYLYGIMRNKAFELCRTKKKESNVTDLQFWSTYVQGEESATDEEKILAAASALDEMGPPCRDVLQLYYYHDKTMEEITGLLGYKNADTTKNQKYKCLKRLQNLFFQHIHKTLGLEK